MLTEEQIRAAEGGMDPSNVGGARGLSKYRKWPGGIVHYALDSSAGNSYIFSKHHATQKILKFKNCLPTVSLITVHI